MTGGTLRKKRNIGRKLPQYDDGIVRLGRCTVCKRDTRILTKHEVNGVEGVWSCADTEDCCQVVELLTTVSKPRMVPTDAVRKAIEDGD